MNLAALCEQSSLHSPSKILFRLLALADVFVGILSGPLYVIFPSLTIQYERWESVPFYNILMVPFCGWYVYEFTVFVRSSRNMRR